jgi:DNA polymerase-3 subunit alpha (Gram-positive type)
MLQADGAAPAEVIPQLQSFLGALPIVAHNADFEFCFLRRAYEACALPPPANRWNDTIKLAKRLLRGVTNYKLATLTARFGIKSENPHRSLSDCESTRRLYEKLLEMQQQQS